MTGRPIRLNLGLKPESDCRKRHRKSDDLRRIPRRPKCEEVRQEKNVTKRIQNKRFGDYPELGT